MRNGETFSPELLAEAERAIGHRFKDGKLLETSLTHKSYSNTFGGEDNERLEFLGDAVLELAVTEELFRATRSDEGALTELRQRFVSQTALEAACERAGLKKFLRYSGGAHNVGGKTASNLFEAVLGALYLDGGMRAARAFLSRYLVLTEAQNYRSLLQEYVQEAEKKTPSYFSHEENGKFVCTVKALGRSARGEGTSKKAAETAAAKKLYRMLTERS